METKASFITGVKNRSKVLREMLKSLIGQNMQEWEAIVVDDHSEEPIEKVIAGFKDDRIKYFSLPEGQTGISCARNLAIKNAQTDLVITADSDDINRPERAQKIYEVMTANHADVFYSNVEFFDPEKNTTSIPTFQPFNEKLYKMLNFINGTSIAYRRSKVLEVGGFDPLFELSEDYDLLLRILNNGGKFSYLEEVLVDYRRHNQNITVEKLDKLHYFIQKTREKNHIPPVDMRLSQNYAMPDLTKNILTNESFRVWDDERLKGNYDKI